MSDLQWSSPVRQRGMTILPPLPNEIYLEILHFFRITESTIMTEPNVKRDLSNLALVCRFFCSVAVPWLFESLQFTPRVGDGYEKFSSQDYALFCEGIVKGRMAPRKMAKHVNRCSFKMWDLDDDRLVPAHSYREFLSSYCKAVWHMPNIQQLSFLYTSLTKELLQTIGHLRHLKSLMFGDCSLANGVNDRHLRNLSSLKLTSLVIAFNAEEMTFLGGDAALAIHPILKQLNLGSLLELVTNSWYLIQRLSETEEILPLEILDIYMVNDLGVLASVLQRAPSLKTLRICCIRDSSIAKFELDPKALPILEDVEAPVSLLTRLIPGRPISTLRVANSLERLVIRQQDLEALKSSLSPILHMQIPRSFYLEVPFHKHFPRLRTLQVNFFVRDLLDTPLPHDLLIEQAIRVFTQAWTEHPTLHTLNLNFDLLGQSPLCFNLFKQQDWISGLLRPKFPTLRKCLFGDTVHWSYLETSWIPALSPNFFRNLLNHFKSGRITYAQLQEFIRTLLEGREGDGTENTIFGSL